MFYFHWVKHSPLSGGQRSAATPCCHGRSRPVAVRLCCALHLVPLRFQTGLPPWRHKTVLKIQESASSVPCYIRTRGQKNAPTQGAYFISSSLMSSNLFMLGNRSCISFLTPRLIPTGTTFRLLQDGTTNVWVSVIFKTENKIHVLAEWRLISAFTLNKITEQSSHKLSSFEPKHPHAVKSNMMSSLIRIQWSNNWHILLKLHRFTV